MKKALLVMAIAMAAIFARAQLLTPWKAPVECDIPTVTKLYGTQMSAKAVASTASQRSIKAITPTASQTWWGYFSESNASSLDFSGNLGYGSAVTLNAAIMVEGSNSFVKGSTIKAVRFWLADDLSAISSDLTLWVSKSLPASASAADYTQTIPKANISSRLNEVELTTPYDATSMQSGDKLYIGFSFSISGRAYPIMAGGTDMSGGFYYNIGSSWIDFVGEGYKNGNLALQLLLDGGTYPTNCASIDNIGQEVVKSGSSVSIPCKITNKGIDDITSLEFTIKDANGSSQTVTRNLSTPLALNNSTSISLSFDAASTPQKSDISVTVTKVNGVDNTLSASDGLKVGTGTLITVSSAPTVVPVVEEFTGTWCGYCPYGTVAMQKAHQQYGDEIVQIAIHSGDPMAVSDYSPVISAYCDGYPNATIDRQSTFHAANIPYRLTSAFNRVSQGMIELTAEWSDAGKTAVKFNTKSTFGYSDNNGQYGIALVLTEDGMTGTSSNWSQNNYLSGGSGNSDMQFWYNSPSTVSGLEYDHVAVAVWNALNGADGSIPSSFTADTPIEYNFTGDISSNTLIQDKTKLKAVALLIDRVSGKIVNAAQCSLSDGSNPADPPEAYAALSEDNTVLTFYYDANKASRNGMSVGPFTISFVDGVKITGREWNDYVSTITKVVFDATFADYMPTSTAYWFDDCNALTTIAGIENLKTDNVTSMNSMLSGCSSLTSLDVSKFNTSNVKDMSLMFSDCSGLTSLDVSKFNTGNVTDMSGMFYDCSGLTSLDVSNFNTSNVTDIGGMFYDCSGLTSLDVSKFNTEKVTSMSSMFWGCSGLTSLDVSKFNTDNVTSMSDMFHNCSRLTSLDISNFNTDNVASMNSMFRGCSGLISLDVSNFNTEKVTSMDSMFRGCSGLTNLDVSKFNMSNVTNMYRMFQGCSGLTSLDVSNFNTGNVTDMSYMFYGCSSLTSLDVSKFNTEKVTSMSSMFWGCSGLISLDVSSFNTANATRMYEMFYGCSGLTSIYAGDGWNTDKVETSSFMFSGCSSLVGGAGTVYDDSHTDDKTYARIDGGTAAPGYFTDKNGATPTSGNITFADANVKALCVAKWDTNGDGELSEEEAAAVTDLGNTFKGNTKIKSFDELQYFTGLTSIGERVFFMCLSLTSITIPNSVTSIGKNAFQNCTNLNSIEIPNSVTNIVATPFRNCNSLTTITVASDNPVYDSRDGCNAIIRTEDNAMIYGCTKTTIPNSVTSIGGGAFYDCKGLSSIEIPNSVTSIETNAFSGCSGLTSITVVAENPIYDSRGGCNAIIRTSDNTLIAGCSATIIPNSVTSIEHWAFYGCSSLTSIEIPNSVTSIGFAAFDGCTGLTSITIPNSVTNIESQTFLFCESLTSITIPNSVTSIGYSAFNGCTGLTSVEIPNSVTSIGEYAFSNCTSLSEVHSLIETPFAIGDKTFGTYDNVKLYVPAGTAEVYKATDGWKNFVNIIEEGGSAQEPEPYAVLSDDNTVLTFYYDGNKASRNGMDIAPFGSSSSRGWNSTCESIQSVVFDASFANCTSITSTGYWFDECSVLKSITGIENLKTDNVTDMSSMFRKCSSLTSLDVSGFKTDNVKYMNGMFSGCSGLTTLDVSGFNTANVTNMDYMFYCCWRLISLDVSGFKTDNVTSMLQMFLSCSGLTSLDVSGFKTDNVVTMNQMFDGCSSLTSLDVSGFNTANVMDMGVMFKNCSGLTSLDLSGFKTDKVKNMSGMFYGCSSLTNLDVSGFNTGNLTSTYQMFYGCSGLTSLDVSSFNTANATRMYQMFYGCSGLTSLDLSGFKTDNVTDMEKMFDGCSGLTSIYAGDGWNTDKVETSTGMFSGCTSLVGGAGTVYNSSYIDKTYARIDGGTAAPGYFTDKNSTAPTSGNITFADANVKALCVTKWDTNGDGELSKDEAAAVTTLGNEESSAFYRNAEITSFDELQYFTGLTKLNSNNFYGCKALISITLPETLTEIGDAVFVGCESLVTLNIPASVTQIGDGQFTGCQKLESVTVSEGNTKFESVEGVLFTKAGSGEMRTIMAYPNKKGTTYVVPEGTEVIAPFAFCYTDITEVTLPETINGLGYYAFAYCSKLNAINCESTNPVGVRTDAFDKNVFTNATLNIPFGTKAKYQSLEGWKEFSNIVEAVDERAITITANDLTKVYGDALPEFTFKTEGGELSGEPALTCEATATSPAGTYPITVKQGTVTNPNATYVNGKLTITKAPLTISVGEYTRQEGEENPEFELTYSGFKNGESDGALTKQPTVKCIATKDSESGEYVISIEGAEAENYDISYIAGTLTVTAKPLPEITPIEGEMTVNTEGLSEGDLTDNVVNDVYYNVCEGGYDATDKSIVISKPTNMAQITDKEPGSKDVKENFNGMILKVGKGKGLITVNVKTSGNAQLVVQVGNGTPMLASKTEKGDVVFRYDVEEDTYVYIYAIIGSSAAKGYGLSAADTESSVRIYSITVSPGATGIRSIGASEKNNAVIYDLQGRRVENPAKGIYIMDGRKVSVK